MEQQFPDETDLAYIITEEIDGSPYHVIHDADGDPLAMSEVRMNLISYAATRGIRICAVH